MRARGAQAQTGARARRASKDRRTREVREQGAGFGELICDLESLFARAESLFARARVGRARARTRARILALLAHLARARFYLLARLAHAPVVARAPRARTC